MSPEIFMREAIKEADAGMRSGRGGPFGCVIVHRGEIIARGNNRVTSTNDPTAHAEITAIREACATLRRFSLEECELYTSCEPCPLCLSASLWARLDAVYFAADRHDAAAGGFDDAEFYEFFARSAQERDRALPVRHVDIDTRTEPFEAWAGNAQRTAY